jgi:hypothetical protein
MAASFMQPPCGGDDNTLTCAKFELKGRDGTGISHRRSWRIPGGIPLPPPHT